jgi:hypothetical protein
MALPRRDRETVMAVDEFAAQRNNGFAALEKRRGR